MARQLRTPSAPSSSHAPYAPTFVERRLNNETIKLLRAPKIEDSTMWKQQCFESVYNTLRKKLTVVNCDALISLFSDHFPLETTTAELSAQNVVEQFRASFRLI